MIGAFIFCEYCGRADFYPLLPKNRITSISRRVGWSIGKQTICPACRTKKNTGGRLVIKAELLPMQKEEQRHEEE
jgi:hypothetical protein